jgi:predicted DNA-binding protein
MSELCKLHRRKFVTIRVTSEEKEQFEKIASEANKDVSTYVRELVLAQ